jgi:hypothetical protein
MPEIGDFQHQCVLVAATLRENAQQHCKANLLGMRVVRAAGHPKRPLNPLLGI